MTVAPILIENIFFILEASGLSSWLPPFIERKGSVGEGFLKSTTWVVGDVIYGWTLLRSRTDMVRV